MSNKVTTSQVYKYLETQNLNHGLDGYRFLLAAIEALVENGAPYCSMTDLYKKVSAKVSVSPRNVEARVCRVLKPLKIKPKAFIYQAADALIFSDEFGGIINE